MQEIFARLEKIFRDHWYVVTLGILCFPFFCFVLGSLGFLVKIPLTKWHGVAAFFITVAVIWRLSPTQKCFAGRLAAVMGILLISLLFSSFTVNFGPDPRTYHKPAAYFMADGWNPVWQENLEEYLHDRNIEFWPHLTHAHHFSKGQWIVVAITYLMTGNIDAGDYVNVVFLFAVFSVGYVTLRDWLGVRRWEALLAAMVISLSPYTIVALQLGFMDGILGNAWLIFFFGCLMWLKTTDRKWIPLVMLAAIFCCNVKFTAVAHCGVAGMIFSLPVLWNTLCRLRRWNFAWNGFAEVPPGHWFSAMFGIFLMVLILGWHPYITNTYTYHHPFYPVMSSDKEKFPVEDICSVLYRQHDFRNASPLQRFVFSYFLAQPCVSADKPADYLFPCRVSELLKFPSIPMPGTVELNGFQWIFGLALLVSLVLLFFVRGGEKWLAVSVFAAMLLVQPHAWFARFLPFFWAFPILIFCMIRVEAYPYPWLNRRTACLCGILTFMLLAQGMAGFGYKTARILIKPQIDLAFDQFINEHPGGKIVVCFLAPGDMATTAVLTAEEVCFSYYIQRTLAERGVDVEVTEDAKMIENLMPRGRIFYQESLYCLPDAEPKAKKYEDLGLAERGVDVRKIPASLWQTVKLRAWQMKNVWIGE